MLRQVHWPSLSPPQHWSADIKEGFLKEVSRLHLEEKRLRLHQQWAQSYRHGQPEEVPRLGSGFQKLQALTTLPSPQLSGALSTGTCSPESRHLDAKRA